MNLQVNWVGQTIGAIVAESHEQARDAARQVIVKYEERSAIIMIEVCCTLVFYLL